MTRRHGAGHPGDEAVDRWLAHHGRALADALGEALDIGAGLREVLVQSRQDDAEDSLEDVLDEESGLAAILPADPSPSTGRTPGPRGRTAAQEFLGSVSPADRLTLRCDPEVTAAARCLDRAVDLTRDPDGGQLVLARAVDLARDLVLDISRAGDLDYDIVLALDPVLAQGLAHALRSATAIEALHLPVARAFARNSLSDDIAVARDLNLARARGLGTARARCRDLNRVLDRARDLALRLAGAARDVDAVHRAEEASGLADVLVAIRAEQVGRAIARVTRQEPPPLDKDTALAFLHDFTTADLRTADLKGIDLGGVHWSESGTRWPAAVDLDDLKRRSVETPAGSTTWVVRWGTAEYREFATL
ncbi:hypothetical protein Slala03_65330 [Streptomyces lavendulae subsp. lavendulae]|uniref:hypothetical protein n=1 Tax=Streptomyces lavendulae TaxID=1914 RepID=UPI0024A58CA1|nr:hypothetical protein [Streptomyces lavendulae]GLV86844.1 hypothetical protein Slala03_65330 [Streptomyces lavendulae subsp. lavendulae]